MSVELACKFISETDSAVLVLLDDTAEEEWFPLSQVEEMHKNKAGVGSIVISEWLARKRGLR